MNKTGYQPMPVLLRAEPNDARWTSKSAKILTVVATLGTLVTLCGAVAICMIGFNAFPRKTLESKAPVAVPILPEVTPSVAGATANHEDGARVPLADANQADHSIPFKWVLTVCGSFPNCRLTSRSTYGRQPGQDP